MSSGTLCGCKLVGQRYNLAAVFATAIHVGAESRRPPAARVNAVSTQKKGGPASCFNCGSRDHKFYDCPKPLKTDLMDKKKKSAEKKSEGEKP